VDYPGYVIRVLILLVLATIPLAETVPFCCHRITDQIRGRYSQATRLFYLSSTQRGDYIGTYSQ